MDVRRYGKAPVWGQITQKLTLFFVYECPNFDLLSEKITKTAKNTIIKIGVG